jgi:hypothetical protein
MYVVLGNGYPGEAVSWWGPLLGVDEADNVVEAASEVLDRLRVELRDPNRLEQVLPCGVAGSARWTAAAGGRTRLVLAVRKPLQTRWLVGISTPFFPRRWAIGSFRAVPAGRLLLEGNPIRRRLLENQGSRPAAGTERFAPGIVVSAQLAGCAHRVRVEALAAELLPERAKCPTRRWSSTLPGTARLSVRNAAREVVRERVDVRDGREFQVQVLKTPRRARKHDRS